MSERGAMILDDLLTQPLVQPTSGVAVGMQDALQAERARLGVPVRPEAAASGSSKLKPSVRAALQHAAQGMIPAVENPDDPVLVTDPEAP